MLRSRKGACVGIAFIIAMGSPRMAAAEEVWAVRSGQATFHFNVDLLRNLGLELTGVKATAPAPEGLMMEEPNWTFTILAGSDLRFRAEHGIALPGGIVGGVIRLGGELAIRQSTSGREQILDDLEIALAPGSGPEPTEKGGRRLHLRAAGTGGAPVFCELVDSMFDFHRQEQALSIHYLNARIAADWAKSIGRPELAGWVIGMGEVRASTELLAATPSSTPPYVPNFDLGVLDVSLGRLTNIQQVGHDGVFPVGFAALSMSTTSCNVGTVDVPWLAPMNEDHPLIHMALYRLMNGRLEQIGVSDMKHGFYALSNSDCTPCEHPSNGSFLGVGCSDTYGVGNNSDRQYLAPRREVNAYAGTWECTGSHFAGGQPDCVRRHGGSSSHTVLDHRLIVADADLALPGATYYYESYYVVRGDQNLANNWGSRLCTMSWNGAALSFTTPSSNNPLVEGPALARWGELATYVNAADGDGRVLLVVQTTDLGNGRYHYEYGLLNMESDRQIRSFAVPVSGVPNITNIGFHDSDSDPANDWKIELAENGILTWHTDTYLANPNAHALEFGIMFNFRFDAEAPPAALNAALGLFKPGPGTEAMAATLGPESPTAGLGDELAPRVAARLIGIRPNPLNATTTIEFELGAGSPVRLDIYEAAGRLIRTVVDRRLEAGSHAEVWDGAAASGERVRSGVYYARLKAGRVTAVEPMVVVN